MSQPLILTLQMDEIAQACYETLRCRYFPPDRNVIPAHLTLFHHLPDTEATREAVRDIAHETSAFVLTNPAPRSIGRGVAVFLQAEPLRLLHARLSVSFQDNLIPQDRQPFRPHIVVQNKVLPEVAKQTLSQLDAGSLVQPTASGLTLWRYLDGPWERLYDFAFTRPA